MLIFFCFLYQRRNWNQFCKNCLHGNSNGNWKLIDVLVESWINSRTFSLQRWSLQIFWQLVLPSCSSLLFFRCLLSQCLGIWVQNHCWNRQLFSPSLLLLNDDTLSRSMVMNSVKIQAKNWGIREVESNAKSRIIRSLAFSSMALWYLRVSMLIGLLMGSLVFPSILWLNLDYLSGDSWALLQNPMKLLFKL